MHLRARRTMLAWLIVLLLGACNEAPPGLLASPSADATGTPDVAGCSTVITSDETSYLGGIDSLTWQADLVIEGTVSETLLSVWPKSGDVRQITTDSIIYVDQRIAGDAGDTVRVRRNGGTVGCSSLENAVAPQLRDGDRLLLFLQKDDTPGLPDAFRLLGQGQGYWQIQARDQIDRAIKLFHTDTGTVGNPNGGETVQGIVEKVERARAEGTPTPDDGKAGGFQAIGDGPPSDGVMHLYLTEGVVITGTVIEQLPAQWTTRDGQRPVNLMRAFRDQQTIVRPIVIELDGAPLYDSYGIGAGWTAGQRITVVAEGGQVGGSVISYGYNYDTQPVYVPGQRVLLMLTYFRRWGAGFGRVMTPSGLAWNVSSTYYIVGDRVNSTNSSERSELLTEFEQRIEAIRRGAPSEPWPP